MTLAVQNSQHHKLLGIYAICDFAVTDIQTIARVILEAAIPICQIRSKTLAKQEIIHKTKQLKSLLGNKAIIIVNDDLDIALACTADGIHIGQNDLPINIVKKNSPKNFIIGVTVHSPEQSAYAADSGANYIAAGALFPTMTKKNATLISLDNFKNIIQDSKIPTCAIGGINQSNIQQIMEYEPKPNMIAVHAAIWKKDNIFQSAQNLTAKFAILNKYSR